MNKFKEFCARQDKLRVEIVEKYCENPSDELMREINALWEQFDRNDTEFMPFRGPPFGGSSLNNYEPPSVIMYTGKSPRLDTHPTPVPTSRTFIFIRL